MANLLAWADNSVTVSYNGNTATVTVDDNVAQYLTVTQSGAHVSIVQSSNVAEEITYTLTGTSTDGEFYMSGSYKATIELNGLTLTNMTPVYSGAAVHIQNGKRINVKVITGTTNTLTDAASGTQKGCLYVKGHAEFKQYGTLNVVGNLSHGIKAGEYITVKNATINVTSAVGDGISCNQYFLMESGSISISGTGDDGIQCDLDGDTSTGMTVNHEDEDSGNFYLSGGTITINCPAVAAKGIKSVGDIYISDNAVINITTSGKGMWDTTDLEAKAACGLNADGNITISGGTITLTAIGSGGKGMSCDNVLTITGGNTTVSTSGGLYYNNGSNENLNYTGNTENISSNYYCSPKGVKAGTKTTSGYNTTYSGGIDISGGSISVTTTGNNAEGIESKNYLNITGGEVTVDAHDDGINSALDLTISDGYVYARGSNNDGIDANGDVFIQGGLIYAIGANSPEVAIDANSEENKKFYFTGGTLIAIGGLERGSSLSQTCYQSSSWSTNSWYSMTFGSTVIAFKTPSSGGSPLVVSAASTPTLKSGVTVNGGNSIFGGRCYLDPTVSGGSNVSLSQYTGGGTGPNPPGPGQNYTISASASPQAGGTVSGAGSYPRNSTCTLVATANSGYTFTKWTRNGQQVSTNATYSFQVTGNASFVANFTLNSYTVTASANPTEGGSVSGMGTYNHGTSVTLTATANEGYDFMNWTENGAVVSTDATYTFVITANRNLVANFEESYPAEGAYLIVEGYTPEAAPVNEETNLSLSLKNMGVDPTDGLTTVTLTCDDNRLNILDGTAEFDILPADETITLQDAFSFVIADGVEDGTQFQINVEMTCGDETWLGEVYITANQAVLEYQNMVWDGSFVPGETITLTAKFKNIGHYQAVNAVATMTSSSDYITVSNSPISMDTIALGEEVSCNFTVTVADNCPASAVIPVTFTMTADGGLMAEGNETLKNSCMVFFALHDSYGDGWNGAKLTVSFDDGTPSQDLTITSGNSANYSLEIGNGVHVTLTWTKGNYDSECSFTVSYEGDLVIYQMAQGTSPSAGVLYEFDCNCAAATAVFNVNVTSSNVAQGTVSGGGEFSYGESCTVTATPNEGYFFKGWVQDGTIVSTSAQYTFNVISDMDLVAHFIQAIEIGEATTTNNFLPSYNYYKYSLTQQIYTVEEIGTAGTITSIAFYNEGAEKTRTYDFYLKPTTKSSFSSKTDWITVAETDKVFSGSVTMAANAWTFVNFSTPFEYDGTSNLVLVADDNTNAWTSSPHMSCSVFNTSSSQAIYYWDDNTNFNPLSPPTSAGSSTWSGTTNDVLSVKNHILLGIETSVPQVQQTVELSQGWNWFSSNVEITLDDLKAALVEVLPGTSITIKSRTQNVAYNPNNHRWTGQLNSFDVIQMYMIYVNTDCEITLTGMPINPAEHPVTINSGSNWIAFPLGESMSLSDAFEGFAVNGDKVKSRNGNSQYIRNHWSGGVTTLVPGQGYMYISNTQETRTFTFPASVR